MLESKPHEQWSRLNELEIVEAMQLNRESEHWGMCSEFVRHFLDRKFSNLPSHLKDEVVQETILSVYRSFATFRHESKFTTWVVSIARNRAIDALRRPADTGQAETSLDDLAEFSENGADLSTSLLSKTPEEITLTNELLRETMIATEAFIQMHAKRGRNRQILYMVLFQGLSQKETAERLGVPAPVVGVVVRNARAHLRQVLLHTTEKKPDPNK